VFTLDRGKIARWLIDKLLASYLISLIIIYGPIFGFNVQSRGLGVTYSVVTTISVLISILSNLLIPQDFGIKRRYDNFISRLKGETESEENTLE
jgi:hypothetical protein